VSVRARARTSSEICVTAATVLILFVVHVVLGAGVRAADASDGRARPGRHPAPTVCEPERGSGHRLIVRTHPDATRPVSEGVPPASTG
jgi:hypothetical protein